MSKKKKRKKRLNAEVIKSFSKKSKSIYFPLECLISCFPCSCIESKISAGTDETDPKGCLIRVYTIAC